MESSKILQDRISKLEGAYEQVDQRLGDLTGAVESLRGDLTASVDSLRSDMDSLRQEFNTSIVVVASTGIVVAGTLIAFRI